jgi:hypothetical protein
MNHAEAASSVYPDKCCPLRTQPAGPLNAGPGLPAPTATLCGVFFGEVICPGGTRMR